MSFFTVGNGCSLELPPRRLDPSVATRLIEDAFRPSRRASKLPLAERLALDAQRDLFSSEESPCAPSTYGTLPNDVFTDPALAINGSSHVLDLGAGDGRLLTTAVLLHGTSSGVGVEMAATRVADGCTALQRLAAALSGMQAFAAPEWPLSAAGEASRPSAPVRTVELRVGDALVEPIRPSTSHVLMYATCFPLSLAQALQQRLAAELPGGARVLAAGARGWLPKMRASHVEEGPRWLRNDELSGQHGGGQHGLTVEDGFVATPSDVHVAHALEGDFERPCLGDVGAMVWRVEPCTGPC
jgi:hypothetical protein